MRGPKDWQSIQAEYECGASYVSLSKKYGLSRQAIMKRAKKEKWTQDAEEQINRSARAKLGGYDHQNEPTAKAAAIEAEADRRAGIIAGHRTLFEHCRALYFEALELRQERVVDGKAIGGRDIAFNAMKLTKISTEAARNIMLAERIAYGIAEGEERGSEELPEEDKALLARWQKEYANTKDK